MIADLALILDTLLWAVLALGGIVLMSIGRAEREVGASVGGVGIVFLVFLRLLLIFLPSLIHQQPFIYR